MLRKICRSFQENDKDDAMSEYEEYITLVLLLSIVKYPLHFVYFFYSLTYVTDCCLNSGEVCTIFTDIVKWKGCSVACK